MGDDKHANILPQELDGSMCPHCRGAEPWTTRVVMVFGESCYNVWLVEGSRGLEGVYAHAAKSAESKAAAEKRRVAAASEVTP